MRGSESHSVPGGRAIASSPANINAVFEGRLRLPNPSKVVHFVPMTLAAGFRLGPYEIVSLVGRGGMGEVYRAHDSRLDRDVAIKVLPAAA
jgi:serine/threonine protein kinase